MLYKALATTIVLVGCAGGFLSAQSADSLSLNEVSVVAVGPKRLIKIADDGALSLSSALLGESPSFMATPDPVALIRSLPAVSTANELQAAISVRGGSQGDNTFTSDGARIVNPMHMLGLYSAFNPAFYRSYTFRVGRIPVSAPSTTAGLFEASSMGAVPDSAISATLSLGLIESHGTLRIPLRPGKSSLAIGARHTYLSLLFPHILTLGKSEIDYGFTDINLAFSALAADNHRINISLFADRDRMGLNNKANGTKDGRFGWQNLAASASWNHGPVSAIIAYSHFSNNFVLEEGSRRLDLPSSLDQLSASSALTAGNFHFSAEAIWRATSGQTNKALSAAIGAPARKSGEGALSAAWHGEISSRLSLDAGIRMALYGCGSFFSAVPQPRASLTFDTGHEASIFAAYSRLARFDRLIEETTGSLPADFWTCADNRVKPEDVHSFEIGISGIEPLLRLSYIVEGYYKIMRHTGEFAGSLVDLANASYNPLDDYLDGRGYAAGLSMTLLRQFGPLRGRAAYNLGIARARFDRFGNEYFPTAHDRLHDLTVALVWQPLRPLSISASFTHATGTPYTRAKYGYMIGENLICEYYPHNSSRLPAYNRLDLGASWRFTSRHLTHTLSASVYNALACRNILFIYSSYSVSEGIEQRRSEMNSVIPSLSYTLSF